MNSHNIVNLQLDVPSPWPLLLSVAAIIVFFALGTIWSRESIIQPLFYLALLGSLGCVVYFGMQRQNSINDQIINSVGNSYSASFRGTSGTDGNEFNARDKESIILTDNSGKEHQCFFNVTKRKDDNISYYVRCIGEGGVLTPGKALS